MKICDGCGTSKSFEEIKASNPRAISCCPERKMRDLLPAEYEQMRALANTCRDMDRSYTKNSAWNLNTPWYQEWVSKIIAQIPPHPL